MRQRFPLPGPKSLDLAGKISATRPDFGRSGHDPFPYPAREQVEAVGNVLVEQIYRDPTTGKPITIAWAGQRVQVESQVILPKTGFDLIVEDPLPGGLEALNERLNTTGHDAMIGQELFYWSEYGYNHKEVWGDRVLFFITGTWTGWRATDLARAVRRGHSS